MYTYCKPKKRFPMNQIKIRNRNRSNINKDRNKIGNKHEKEKRFFLKSGSLHYGSKFTVNVRTCPSLAQLVCLIPHLSICKTSRKTFRDWWFSCIF